MKHLLSYFLVFFNILFISSQDFDTETIKNSGNNDKRINLVILSEGYQESELSQFKTDAESLVNDMFTQSPFLEYTNYFNVHIIKVPSYESGADHPGTATDVTEPYNNLPTQYVDTYFNATYDAFGFHRFLYYGIDYADSNSAELKIISVLADNFPTYDQALLLVNSSEYGGTGGQFPISSITSNEIAIHELGHSMFNLKDEYLLPDVYYAEAINMTQKTDPSSVKWKNWINENGIGIYQHGTTGVPATWYRPHQNCKMRFLGAPFCSVCKEGIIEKIHDLVSPIESYTPVSNTVNNPSFPLDFQLDLLHPTNKALESIWTLNGSDFANNVDDISINDTDLNVGTNTLHVTVTDNNDLLKIDNHETVHVHTVTWTINNSSLGIDDITSEENQFKIQLYPNPSSTLLNFKIETNTISNFKIDLSGIDGKRIESVHLNDLEHQMNLSKLTAGIYIANIYADGILIASKKIVKL